MNTWQYSYLSSREYKGCCRKILFWERCAGAQCKKSEENIFFILPCFLQIVKMFILTIFVNFSYFSLLHFHFRNNNSLMNWLGVDIQFIRRFLQLDYLVGLKNNVDGYLCFTALILYWNINMRDIYFYFYFYIRTKRQRSSLETNTFTALRRVWRRHGP